MAPLIMGLTALYADDFGLRFSKKLIGLVSSETKNRLDVEAHYHFLSKSAAASSEAVESLEALIKKNEDVMQRTIRGLKPGEVRARVVQMMSYSPGCLNRVNPGVMEYIRQKN
jgi:hypothetical protein